MRRFKKANTKLNKFVLNHYFLSSLNLVHIVYAHLFNIPVINSNLPLKKIRSQTFNTLRSYLQSKNHTPNDLLSLTADEILLKVKGEFLKQKPGHGLFSPVKTEYLRRWGVSLLSSEWDQVVPPRFSDQAKYYSIISTNFTSCCIDPEGGRQFYL